MTTQRALKGQTLDDRNGLAPSRKISHREGIDEADLVLVARARDGAADAFAALYRRHHAAILQVCRRWLRDDHLAEDAAQETFLRGWLALPHYAGTGSFEGWLRRIARNHCHDVWKAQQRGAVAEIPTHVDEICLDRPDTAQEPAGAVGDRLDVAALLDRLSPRDAAMLVEHHALGVPVRGLAHRWRLTRGAMEVALHRARRRARRSARDEGLAVLLPVFALRRMSLWGQRSLEVLRDAGTPVAVSLCHLAVVVVAIGAPPPAVPEVGDGRAGPPPRQITSSAAEGGAASVTQATQSAASRAEPPARQASRKRRDGATAGDRRKRAPEQPPGLVEFDPVPVGDREIRSEPGRNWQRKRSYGVHEPVTGSEVAGWERHKDRNTELEPVDARACPVARSAEPVVVCKTHRR